MPVLSSAIYFTQFLLGTFGDGLILTKKIIVPAVKAPDSQQEDDYWAAILVVEISFKHQNQIRGRKLILLVGGRFCWNLSQR